MATDITTMLRQHQEEDELLGGLFKALHTFADRTMEEFYSDTPTMPYPVVAMEKDRANRLGYYTTKDGYTLVHRINLNPYSLKTGTEAAETLAHEMVHLWQAHIGRPCLRNYHGADFHQRMAHYGILTKGKRGHHTGYDESGTWPAWMKRNEDLELDKYVLPGADQQPKRKLLKFACPECDFSFRTRRADAYVVCMNEDCGVPMELVGAHSSEDE